MYWYVLVVVEHRICDKMIWTGPFAGVCPNIPVLLGLVLLKWSVNFGVSLGSKEQYTDISYHYVYIYISLIMCIYIYLCV